jgi:hypothetical protein
LWARNSAVVTLQLPALNESATLVGVTGDTRQIEAIDGVYSLVLENARCFGECLVGGRPIILFEEAAELNQSPLPTAIQIGQAVPMPTFSFDTILTATPTSEPTETPTATSTQPPTATPTPLPTDTPIPTDTPTETAVTITAATATFIPTLLPVTPTATPASTGSHLPAGLMDQLGLLLVGAGIGIFIGLVVLLKFRR